jgi:hypothetical protein
MSMWDAPPQRKKRIVEFAGPPVSPAACAGGNFVPGASWQAESGVDHRHSTTTIVDGVNPRVSDRAR